MLTLLVTYTAKAGQRDAFLQAVLQSGLPERIRQEDGCLRYDYFSRQSVRTKSCWQNSGHRRNSRRSTFGSPTWHAYSS